MTQQDYMLENIRAAAITTNAHVAGTVLGPSTSSMNPALRNQLNLLISWTKGSLTSLEVKIEWSHDGVTYFQDTFVSISGATATCTLGVYSFTTEGNYVISSPIKYNYVKVSVKGVGTVTSSSCKIDAVVGTV